jgi:hypothetical protein
MSEIVKLSKSKQLIKHILLWIVFGYFYQSGISLLGKMALDAQPDNPLIATFFYAFGFNILVAHLVTKYDEHWPVIGSVFIGLVGLVAVPFLLFGTTELLTLPLLVGILFSLPLSTYVVGLIKIKLNKN